MKELDYLKIIHNVLDDSSLLGDDCAVLTDLGLCVTQDTLVEDIHFSMKTTTPYLLGKKSVNVNLSDLAASVSKPLYITVSLSLPDSFCESFIEEFYKGINDICNEFGIKVAGGDLTSSNKVFISICAFGLKNTQLDISRRYAKPGDIVVCTGFHGDSAGGLKLLMSNNKAKGYLVDKHLCPTAQLRKSEIISNAVLKAGIKKFAMMDTSDGLGDAVYKISKASGVSLVLDNLPVSDELKNCFPNDWNELVLWGGEDFELLFCIPQRVYDLLDKSEFYKIGIVLDKPLSQNMCDEFEHKSYKHFK